jgi:hypothetical protein
LFPCLFTLLPPVCANFYGIRWDQELPAQASGQKVEFLCVRTN